MSLTTAAAHPALPDATATPIGLAALALFLVAYALVVLEERLELRKSKPVMLAAAAIWALVGLYAATLGGEAPAIAGAAFRAIFLEFAELFFFLVVAMSYVSAMTERNVFEALRAELTKRSLSYRQLFWFTGLLSFFLSALLDNLTTALIMGSVVLAVGAGNARFVSLAFVNLVVAANAGGAWSAFGDITTLMVWQAGKAGFFEFFALFVPSWVNFLVPALLMHLAVPKERPAPRADDADIRRGGLAICALFALTIAITVAARQLLGLPPAFGMMAGLALLQLHAYFLARAERADFQRSPVGAHPVGDLSMRSEPVGAHPVGDLSNQSAPVGAHPVGDLPDRSAPVGAHPVGDRSERAHAPSRGDGYNIFRIIANAEWDTLLFFYGVLMCVGGLAAFGWLGLASTQLYDTIGHTGANVVLGVLSAIVDNIPVMYAVLQMDPAMDPGQWLLVTLTCGVGGSLLSVGSAAGVALMGASKGRYTFRSHLRWTWAVAVGYALSIAMHLWWNRDLFTNGIWR